MRVTVATILLILSPFAYGSCGAIAEIEGQIEEMRNMDVPEATIKPMVDQLETLKADNPECVRMDESEREQERQEFRQGIDDAEKELEAEHDIKPDYFERNGKQAYANCDQYESMQTLSLCAAAAEQYSAYWEAAASGEAEAGQLEKLYAVHAKSAENLIRMVDSL